VVTHVGLPIPQSGIRGQYIIAISLVKRIFQFFHTFSVK
jgi:hypothetical protein